MHVVEVERGGDEPVESEEVEWKGMGVEETTEVEGSEERGREADRDLECRKVYIEGVEEGEG